MSFISKIDKKAVTAEFTCDVSLEAIITYFSMKQLELLEAIYDELVKMNAKQP